MWNPSDLGKKEKSCAHSSIFTNKTTPTRKGEKKKTRAREKKTVFTNPIFLIFNASSLPRVRLLSTTHQMMTSYGRARIHMLLGECVHVAIDGNIPGLFLCMRGGKTDTHPHWHIGSLLACASRLWVRVNVCLRVCGLATSGSVG